MTYDLGERLPSRGLRSLEDLALPPSVLIITSEFLSVVVIFEGAKGGYPRGLGFRSNGGKGVVEAGATMVDMLRL